MDTGWIVGGNFNDILHLNEKRGGLPTSLHRCTLFQNRINNCKLIDMGNFGFPFTLRGLLTHGGICIYEKLDRVLCNDMWRNMYPEAHANVLHRLDFSDHHHVLLTLMDKEFRQVPKSFKFKCAWLVENSFKDMLKSAWNNHHSILNNLDSFKTTASQWNLHSICSIRKEKLHLLYWLQGIKKAVQEGLRKLEKKIQIFLSKTLYQEELIWYQSCAT
ncbi:unnamed protein product [Lathyrus oleraceus]